MAKEDEGSRLGFEEWEEAAIRYWSTRVPKPDQQQELRAELAEKLLFLHAMPRAGIRHPKAYIRTALANTAKTWLKKLTAAKQIFSLLESPGSDDVEEPYLGRDIGRDEGDFGIGLHRFFDGLEPRLRRFLAVLEKKNGNLSAAAKALRIHRNTASLWRNQIRELARKHSLDD